MTLRSYWKYPCALCYMKKRNDTKMRSLNINPIVATTMMSIWVEIETAAPTLRFRRAFGKRRIARFEQRHIIFNIFLSLTQRHHEFERNEWAKHSLRLMYDECYSYDEINQIIRIITICKSTSYNVFLGGFIVVCPHFAARNFWHF